MFNVRSLPNDDLKTRALWGLALLALAVRLAFIALEPPTKPSGTSARGWAGRSTNRAASRLPACGSRRFGRTSSSIRRSNPYFIAALKVLTGSLTSVKIGQALLGAALVVALARLGAAVFGARAGIAAAANRRAVSRARLVLRALLVGDPVHGLSLVGFRAPGRRPIAGERRGRRR